MLDNIRLTEKLILYQAYLLEFANNFVSFPHLYDATMRAMFEMGTLVMDGRHFSLSVKAKDRAQHTNVAKTSNMYVLYVEVTPGQGAPKYELAVPVTSGGKGNLCVGKRGLFQDVTGRESDACVVQIIGNPISMREALVSPFQRLGKLVTGKIEAMAGAAEKELDVTASKTVEEIQTGAAAGPVRTSGGGALAGGLLMGAGVAVAALGSALAYITKTLASIETPKIIIALIAAMLAVMLPTSIAGFLKLRRRDLSAILEASGWAINARMRLTFSQGRFFTRQPRFPKGAKGVRRKRLWLLVASVILAATVLLGWYLSQSKGGPKRIPSTSPTSSPKQ